MSKIQDAVALAKQWAADPTHGYDQSNRWGPDYDCSSFLISVWEKVGVKVKTAGASYTGNMRAVFQRCGFELITSWTVSTLQPGDVLLNDANHTAMFIGNGQIVQARINENNATTGGKTGDQTGREIAVQAYYDFPWNCVLRYKEAQSGGNSPHQSPTASPRGEAKEGTYTVKPGDSWWSIAAAELGNGTLYKDLAKLNGKTVNSVIHPGDKLKLWDDDCAECKIDPEKAELEAKVKAKGGKVVWG